MTEILILLAIGATVFAAPVLIGYLGALRVRVDDLTLELSQTRHQLDVLGVNLSATTDCD